MKIAVISTRSSFDSPVGEKLQQAKYLLIVDLCKMDYKVMINPTRMVSGPSMWKLIAHELLEENVRFILSGEIDSDVSKLLGRVGIQVIDGISGSVRNAVKEFKKMCMAETIIIPVENIQE